MSKHPSNPSSRPARGRSRSGTAEGDSTIAPMRGERLVSEKRSYRVLTTEDAKRIASRELVTADLANDVEFGLPEVDDRYHIWRVPLIRPGSAHEKVGEIVIDARSSLVQANRSTDPELVKQRLAGENGDSAPRKTRRRSSPV